MELKISLKKWDFQFLKSSKKLDGFRSDSSTTPLMQKHFEGSKQTTRNCFLALAMSEKESKKAEQRCSGVFGVSLKISRCLCKSLSFLQINQLCWKFLGITWRSFKENPLGFDLEIDCSKLTRMNCEPWLDSGPSGGQLPFQGEDRLCMRLWSPKLESVQIHLFLRDWRFKDIGFDLGRKLSYCWNEMPRSDPKLFWEMKPGKSHTSLS